MTNPLDAIPDPVIKAITSIASPAASFALKQAQRNELVVQALKKLNLDPVQPPKDLDGVYVYAFVEYGVGKLEPILKLWREKEIKKAFWDAYNFNCPLAFLKETKQLLSPQGQETELGTEIREAKIDLRSELEEFGQKFLEVAKRTKSQEFEPYPDWELDIYPKVFKPLIEEKTRIFCGRNFVFKAFEEFQHNHSKGYFTVVGDAGMGKSAIAANYVDNSGKSAILAKYVTSNPHVIYYNAQVKGKNRADQFLSDICTQLINQYPQVGAQYIVPLPDNATEGSWFLSLLLQKISDSLEPKQRLIIAIDALDAIAPNSQSASSNLFYLPRYLPQKVYFLLTRRPFVRERSGLLIEAPSQVLTLEDYPQQNQEDVQAYIQQCLTPLTPCEGGNWRGTVPYSGSNRKRTVAYSGEKWTRVKRSHFSPLFKGGHGAPSGDGGHGGDLEELGERLIQQLTAQSENNFMYLSQILPAIAQGFYSQQYQCDRFPPGLEAYYQSHWQKMKGEELSSVELGVLRTLVTPQNSLDSPLSPLQTAGISAQAVSEAMPAGLIAQIIDEDEYDVEAVLSNWVEFLRRQPIDGEIYYSFYHSSFHHWLKRQSSQ